MEHSQATQLHTMASLTPDTGATSAFHTKLSRRQRKLLNKQSVVDDVDSKSKPPYTPQAGDPTCL
eukprot:8004119-Karenia_brevis.AAC.1